MNRALVFAAALRILRVGTMAASLACLPTAGPAQPVQWNEIAAPTGKEALSRTYSLPFRTDVIDVPLRAGAELEYKIDLKAGATLVYSWEVRGVTDPHSFYTEFHGHTEPVGGRGDLMFYEKGTGPRASGSLIAPWEGIHGWFWQNKSNASAVVRLRMAGFYTIVPGQVGDTVKD
jgi:hypothetical protein